MQDGAVSMVTFNKWDNQNGFQPGKELKMKCLFCILPLLISSCAIISVSPTPEPSVSPTPIVTPTPTPSVTPTPIVTPTPSPSVSPTPSPVVITPVPSFTSPPGWLAMNLGGHNYWSFGIFTDAAKDFSGFFQTNSTTGPVTYGANGYPLTPASAISFMAGNPVGQYTAYWDGNATINFRWSASAQPAGSNGQDVNYGKPGEAYMALDGGEQAYLDVTGNDATFQNLHIFTPGYNAQSVMYLPWFTSHLSGLSSLRAMSFTQVSSSKEVNWSDRVTPANMDWTSHGVPYEGVIELARESGVKSVWVNVPIGASDDYITQMAKLFHSNLPTGTEVIVELSNEIWNWGGGFNGWAWANCEGNNVGCPTGTGSSLGTSYYDGGTPTDSYTRAARAAATKAYRMATLWQIVYADRPGDLSPVFAGQAAWNAWATAGLSWVKTKFNAMPFRYLAIAPYFDYNWNSGQYCPTGGCVTPTQILQAAYQNIVKDVPGMIDQHMSLCRQYGLNLVDYEGGQSFFLTSTAKGTYSATDPATLAQQDPQMGILYDTYYKILQDHGVFRHYEFAYASEPWNKSGYWGLVQNPQDFGVSNVKWQAVQRQIVRQK